MSIRMSKWAINFVNLYLLTLINSTEGSQTFPFVPNLTFFSARQIKSLPIKGHTKISTYQHILFIHIFHIGKLVRLKNSQNGGKFTCLLNFIVPYLTKCILIYLRSLFLKQKFPKSIPTEITTCNTIKPAKAFGKFSQ